MSKINQSSACRDDWQGNEWLTMEPVHPLFETNVIGVHVLNVVGIADRIEHRSWIDWTTGIAIFQRRCCTGLRGTIQMRFLGVDFFRAVTPALRMTESSFSMLRFS